MSDTSEKLKDRMVMLERGLITRAEFDQEKRRLLGSPQPSEAAITQTRVNLHSSVATLQ